MNSDKPALYYQKQVNTMVIISSQELLGKVNFYSNHKVWRRAYKLGGEGGCSYPSYGNYVVFWEKQMIQETTLDGKHSKIMLLA